MHLGLVRAGASGERFFDCGLRPPLRMTRSKRSARLYPTPCHPERSEAQSKDLGLVRAGDSGERFFDCGLRPPLRMISLATVSPACHPERSEAESKDLRVVLAGATEKESDRGLRRLLRANNEKPLLRAAEGGKERGEPGEARPKKQRRPTQLRAGTPAIRPAATPQTGRSPHSSSHVALPALGKRW
jgi:hypothetical protein